MKYTNYNNYFIKSNDYAFENINKVARNTYMLLSLTILFSALTALISIKTNVGKINILYFIFISFGLLYLIEICKNNIFGLIFIFAFTGFDGYFIGPILKPFLITKNGQNLIYISLFLTSFIFLFLSLYVFISKRNFNFLNGFIFIGSILILFLILLSIFIKITLFQALISGIIIIFSSSLILYNTSAILHGEETNYISATISLYLQIYNIFISILNILNIFSSKD